MKPLNDAGLLIRLVLFVEHQIRVMGVDVEPETQRICDKLRGSSRGSMIKIGEYQLCVLDLLTDSRTGRLSASKIWFHASNVIMSWVMITKEVDWLLMAAYGAIVGGSYVAVNLFKWKFRDAQPQGDYSGDSNADAELRASQPEDGVRGKGKGKRPE